MEPNKDTAKKEAKSKLLNDGIRKFLFTDSLPNWFWITTALLASVGTYWLAPEISKRSEKNRMKTEMVIDWMADQNATSSELIESLTRVQTYRAQGSVHVPEELDAQISALFAKLHWHSSTVLPLLPKNSYERTLHEYQANLSDLQQTYILGPSKKNTERLLKNIGDLSDSSMKLNGLVVDLTLE